MLGVGKPFAEALSQMLVPWFTIMLSVVLFACEFEEKRHKEELKQKLPKFKKA